MMALIRSLLSTVLLTLAFAACGVEANAQSPYILWDDEDNLHGAFLFNPAYRSTTDHILAAPGHFTSYASGLDASVFFLNDNQFEYNTSLFLQSSLDASSGIFSLGELTNKSSLFPVSTDSRDNWIVQHSQSVLFAYQAYNKSKEKGQAKNLIRIGVIADKGGSLRYRNEFASLVPNLDFTDDPTLSGNALGDFGLDYHEYYGLVIGKSIELRPLRTALGFNIKGLAGISYMHTEMTEDGESIRVTSSGFDTEGGRFKENTSAINGTGGAIDLGFSWRVTRNWKLNLGATDLGFISWTDLEETTLDQSPEVLLGTAPFSNLIAPYDSETNYSRIDSLPSVILEGSDASRIWLDNRINVSVSGQYDRLGIHGMFSRAMNNLDSRHEYVVGEGRVSYMLNQEGKVRVRLASGLRYSDYSGTSLSVSARADLTWLDVYIGSDGFMASDTPYSRSIIFLGIQLSPSGKIDLERL